jgi:hypothetical protein
MDSPAPLEHMSLHMFRNNYDHNIHLSRQMVKTEECFYKWKVHSKQEIKQARQGLEQFYHR